MAAKAVAERSPASARSASAAPTRTSCLPKPRRFGSPRPSTARHQSRAELLPLSARSPEALAALAGRYESALASGVGLADLCYTAGARRGHLEHRLSVVADSPAAMSESLAAYRHGQSWPGISVGRCRPGQRPDVVFAFPGQGSQWHGMGRRLQAEEPVFRDALAACDRALEPYLGSSVLEALAKDEELTDIGLIQPAIFAIQVALAALWRSWGVEPTAVVGHSMGEVAAAHVAGALSLEDAARVICTRALMLRTVRGRGTMMAAELSLRRSAGAHRRPGEPGRDRRQQQPPIDGVVRGSNGFGGADGGAAASATGSAGGSTSMWPPTARRWTRWSPLCALASPDCGRPHRRYPSTPR